MRAQAAGYLARRALDAVYSSPGLDWCFFFTLYVLVFTVPENTATKNPTALFTL